MRIVRVETKAAQPFSTFIKPRWCSSVRLAISILQVASNDVEEVSALAIQGRACALLILMLLTLGLCAANAAESPRPVFVKAACDGKSSAMMISALRQEIENSLKYRLVTNATDNGEMNVVWTIEAACTERNNFVAIATIFGRVKCLAVKDCRLAIDPSSIRSDLCNSDGATECARSLLKAFDDYLSGSSGR